MYKKIEKFQVEKLEQRFEMGWGVPDQLPGQPGPTIPSGPDDPTIKW